MIVNNIDLTQKYKVAIIEKNIQNCEVITYNDWLDNAIDPVKLKEEEFKFSNITVKLLVEGLNENEILTKISDILITCKSGVLKFSDIDYFYNITLNASTNKRICPVAYELALSLQGAYKFMNDEIVETMNRITTKTITATGNLETPAIVEITPSVNAIDLILTINGEIITLKNLTAGKKIILNGVDGTVTELGINKFKDTDLWAFPSLKAGVNSIVASRNTCDIIVKYKPRFI